MHQRDQLSNVARSTYMLNNELGKHHILNNTGEQGTFLNLNRECHFQKV
jgi:hypothetical protein